MTEVDAVPLAIRCDADLHIGAGHAMRCIALAERLSDRGFDVTFVGRFDDLPWVHQLLSRWKIRLPETTNWSAYRAVVVDTYRDMELEARHWRGSGTAIIQVVDQSTPPVSADLYICPGITYGWTPPEASAESPRLCGASAILLRHEITDFRPFERHPETYAPLRVTVVLGGIGASPYLDAILANLSRQSPAVLVQAVAKPLDNALVSRVSWHQPGPDLAPVLSRADLLVCAAGVTAWEALYLGCAVGLVTTVDNQEANYRFMTEAGVASPLGRLHLGEPLDVAALCRLLADETRRARLRAEASRLVDGKGADRAAEAVAALVGGATSNDELGGSPS